MQDIHFECYYTLFCSLLSMCVLQKIICVENFVRRAFVNMNELVRKECFGKQEGGKIVVAR